jgi:hypothetical protein
LTGHPSGMGGGLLFGHLPVTSGGGGGGRPYNAR